jgi:hypothetical protein
MTDEPNVNQDTFVEFTSQIGNTIVIPSQWSQDNDGGRFRLESPDGQALIMGLTSTDDGTGELTEFGDMMVERIDGDWKDAQWEVTEIGGGNARKKKLQPQDEDVEFHWIIYVLRKGQCLHAICLNASPDALFLNEEFYEDLVKTFNGISRAP